MNIEKIRKAIAAAHVVYERKQKWAGRGYKKANDIIRRGHEIRAKALDDLRLAIRKAGGKDAVGSFQEDGSLAVDIKGEVLEFRIVTKAKGRKVT